MTDAELKQLFWNKFDAYVDTYDEELKESREVIPAMSIDRFVEVVSKLLRER